MKKSLLLLAFMLAFALSPVYADNSTKTIEYSMSDTRTGLDVGESATFLKNVEISNFEGLLDFTIFFRTSEGVSNISVEVSESLCGSNRVGPITQGEYVCTSQLTDDLESSIINITLTNNGDAASGNDTVTVGIVRGHFTVNSNVSVSVSGLTAEQNATLYGISEDTDTIIDRINNFVLVRLDRFESFTNTTFFDNNTAEHQLTRSNLTEEIQGVNQTIANSTVNVDTDAIVSGTVNKLCAVMRPLCQNNIIRRLS